MALGKPRDLKKESFWRRTTRDQARSMESVRAWCRKHGFSQATFYWWRRELARRDDGQTTFVPVHVAEDEAPRDTGRIEIALAGARRITVCGRVDRVALAEVLAVVEGSAC